MPSKKRPPAKKASAKPKAAAKPKPAAKRAAKPVAKKSAAPPKRVGKSAVPIKSANPAPGGKPTIPSKFGSRPATSLKPMKFGAPTGEPTPAPVDADAGEQVPIPPLMKPSENGALCQIEILKDGHFFIARTVTESGVQKEYKNTVFEDLLTEMLITLQEQLAE